ncbi:MAG: dTMP kinase [Lysobacteraceae bacterium]|nr:MAG: dTMP kinase [Xanthomonadaceae bacterium]
MTDGLQTQARLLTIEGGEGVGKSTVLSALRDALQADGFEVVSTREPGGTPLAERIRGLLLDPTHEPAAPGTELLLMFAARAQHVREVVLPALARGAWVISDRFTDSSYAYQGAARGLDAGFIAELERRVVGIEPGLTLLLDLGVAHGRERTRGRDLLGGSAPDRIERERDEFFERVRDGFLARAAQHPRRFRVLDASPSAQQVAAAALAVLADYRKAMP